MVLAEKPQHVEASRDVVFERLKKTLSQDKGVGFLIFQKAREICGKESDILLALSNLKSKARLVDKAAKVHLQLFGTPRLPFAESDVDQLINSLMKPHQNEHGKTYTNSIRNELILHDIKSLQDLPQIAAYSLEYAEQIAASFLPMLSEQNGKVYDLFKVMIKRYDPNTSIYKALTNFRIDISRNSIDTAGITIDDIIYVENYLVFGGPAPHQKNTVGPIAHMKHLGYLTLKDLPILFMWCKKHVVAEVASLLELAPRSLTDLLSTQETSNGLQYLDQVPKLLEQFKKGLEQVSSSTIEPLLQTVTQLNTIVRANIFSPNDPDLAEIKQGILSLWHNIHQGTEFKYLKRVKRKIKKEWGNILELPTPINANPRKKDIQADNYPLPKTTDLMVTCRPALSVGNRRGLLFRVINENVSIPQKAVKKWDWSVSIAEENGTSKQELKKGKIKPVKKGKLGEVVVVFSIDDMPQNKKIFFSLNGSEPKEFHVR